MKNEPVAWYNKNSNDYLIENIGQPSFQVQEFIDAGYIPLYTHPVKELTDRIAELEKHNEALADEYAIQVNEVCRLSYEIEKLELQTKPLSDEEIWKVHEDCYEFVDEQWSVEYMKFARAIEERHGIK